MKSKMFILNNYCGVDLYTKNVLFGVWNNKIYPKESCDEDILQTELRTKTLKTHSLDD